MRYILLPILLTRRLFFDISFERQNSPQATNPLLLLMHKYLYVIPPMFQLNYIIPFYPDMILVHHRRRHFSHNMRLIVQERFSVSHMAALKSRHLMFYFDAGYIKMNRKMHLLRLLYHKN